jgi:hypothetical protein
MREAFNPSYNSRFDSFLYEVILEEQFGASLTVLSLLARQNMDPWEEATKYAKSPGGAAVANLSDLLSCVMGYSSLDERVRAEAVRLLHLLPSPNVPDPVVQNPVWPVVVGLVKRLKDISGIWIRNDRH